MTDNLKYLGTKVEYDFTEINPRLLEAFSNPMRAGSEVEIKPDYPEFTSLCPVTGQPDFAKICVKYVPDKLCVESKSFKLYLGSFRNAKIFHEAVAQRICDDLVKLLEPFDLEVRCEFTPRGGIAFIPTAVYVR